MTSLIPFQWHDGAMLAVPENSLLLTVHLLKQTGNERQREIANRELVIQTGCGIHKRKQMRNGTERSEGDWWTKCVFKCYFHPLKIRVSLAVSERRFVNKQCSKN